MGVPGFFSWLLKNKKSSNGKLILECVNKKVDYLMLDTNCLLHPCVHNILEKYSKNELKLNSKISVRAQLENFIWERIKYVIDDMIDKLNPEYLYIAIDGVAPIGKILQQRQRRYKYLFDKNIKLNAPEKIEKEEIEFITEDFIHVPKKPISSIELTPGTDYMERIHLQIEKYVEELKKQKRKCIYSSYHEEGEGEHKILQYIKNNINPTDTILIYGLDADLLFLALGTGKEYDLYVMREIQIFSNEELDFDEIIDYNYVEIKQLHKLIENLNISTNDFITLCYFVGNDFLPNLLTLDIKKGGLDKLLSSYDKLKEKYSGNLPNLTEITPDGEIKINHQILKELLQMLLWTEKWIWTNINRDKFLVQTDKDEIEQSRYHKQNSKPNALNNFALGTTANTEGLDKIQFGSKLEYYNYYFGIEKLAVDEELIKRVVKDYITGIEWCINYYLKECVSWSWGYNFLVAPLITDIVNFYPKKISISKTKCQLNPIEQLILAIPPETYHYVISKKIIETISKNKRIGYMFPESFDIDINKETLYWKCQVKIPIVEYYEYLNTMQTLKIVDIKNEKFPYIKNFT
jgi:5'-3' exonuclease